MVKESGVVPPQAGMMWGRIHSVVPGWRQQRPTPALDHRLSPQHARQQPGGTHVPAATLEAHAVQQQAARDAAAPAAASGCSTFAASVDADGSPAPQDFGYSRGMRQRFRVIKELGRGGNGIVTLVTDEQQLFAMKSIPKVGCGPASPSPAG